MSKIIGIHQPNFFPWIGYFLKIARSDIFVFLDDVQIIKTGGSYVNRCKIIDKNGSKWLTAEIKRESGVWLVNETQFFNVKWRESVKGKIHNTYFNSPFYKINKNFVFDIIDFETNNLCEFNINAIKVISDLIGIKTHFSKSSDFATSAEPTERIIDIVNCFSGTSYLSGNGGDNYQEKDKFEANNLSIIYNEFEHPIYKQTPENMFVKGLSIIDYLFNVEIEEIMDFFKRNNNV